MMHAIFRRKQQIVFLSRQSNKASLDFKLLKDCLQEHLPDWTIVESYHYKQTFSSIMRDIFLVATSRACILDGYHPAVSIPKIDQALLVVQLWHALGAIKRFGWQTVGLRTGRPEKMAQSLSMHANYSVVIASGEGCISSYTEAFRYPKEKVVTAGIPRMDYLLSLDRSAQNLFEHETADAENLLMTSGKTNVLYVPTFRDRQNDAEWIKAQTLQLASCLSARRCNLLIKKHPFSSDSTISDSQSHLIHLPKYQSIELLKFADYVVTDYSAIAFEAALIRKKVLFFVPDIDTYRAAPGLNIDVEKLFPHICFRSAEDLALFIARDQTEDLYGSAGFWKFCDDYLISDPEGSTERIAQLIMERIPAQ